MKVQSLKRVESESSYFALDLLQALPEAVLAFDAQGQVVFANHAALALFQAGEKAMTASSLSALFEKESPVLHAAEDVMKTGKAVTLHDARVKEGPVRSLTVRPVEGGGLYLMTLSPDALHVRTDWTEKTRHALKPAQTMARMLAHEIKNPLAGIQGAAQLLSRLDLPEDDKELLGLITRETGRILRLIRKTDIFEDAMPEMFGPVNIHAVLAQATQVVRTAFPGVKIEEKYDPSLPFLHGNFDLLVQAMMNLVKNAAEAGGSKVGVRTFYDAFAARHPDTHEKLPLCVEVSDDGPGIPPEVQARIFEPWFTTKAEGEGLGLAVVSKIVDDHGGAIGVKTGPEGTSFRLSFPLGSKTV